VNDPFVKEFEEGRRLERWPVAAPELSSRRGVLLRLPRGELDVRAVVLPLPHAVPPPAVPLAMPRGVSAGERVGLLMGGRGTPSRGIPLGCADDGEADGAAKGMDKRAAEGDADDDAEQGGDAEGAAEGATDGAAEGAADGYANA